MERNFWSSNADSPFQFKKDNTATNYSKHNFVDYYEDDEGMWTKPLGGSGASAFSTDDTAQDDCFSPVVNNVSTKTQLGLEQAGIAESTTTATNQL